MLENKNKQTKNSSTKSIHKTSNMHYELLDEWMVMPGEEEWMMIQIQML